MQIHHSKHTAQSLAYLEKKHDQNDLQDKVQKYHQDLKIN